MEELIKRLERVIATGAPDKDGMHPISAETVLEVVKGLSEHSTNLAEVGTDLISRQAAIDAIRDMQAFEDDNGQPYLYLYDVMAVFTDEEELPTIHPEPHWIPVTERMPDVGVDGEIEILGYEQLAIADSTFKISNPVLATRKIDDRYELAVLQWEVDGNDRKYWVNDGGSIIKGVTAWMPLPEPYKGVTT